MWCVQVSLKDKAQRGYMQPSWYCVADVVRRGRLRWFGHLEPISVDDWVSACRRFVEEPRRG